MLNAIGEFKLAHDLNPTRLRHLHHWVRHRDSGGGVQSVNAVEEGAKVVRGQRDSAAKCISTCTTVVVENIIGDGHHMA